MQRAEQGELHLRQGQEPGAHLTGLLSQFEPLLTPAQRLVQLGSLQRLGAEIGNRGHKATVVVVECAVAGEGQGEGADRAPFDLQGETGHGPVSPSGVHAAVMRVPRDSLFPCGYEDWLAGANHLGNQRRSVQWQALCPLPISGSYPSTATLRSSFAALSTRKTLPALAPSAGMARPMIAAPTLSGSSAAESAAVSSCNCRARSSRRVRSGGRCAVMSRATTVSPDPVGRMWTSNQTSAPEASRTWRSVMGEAFGHRPAQVLREGFSG